MAAEKGTNGSTLAGLPYAKRKSIEKDIATAKSVREFEELPIADRLFRVIFKWLITNKKASVAAMVAVIIGGGAYTGNLPNLPSIRPADELPASESYGHQGRMRALERQLNSRFDSLEKVLTTQHELNSEYRQESREMLRDQSRRIDTLMNRKR